MDIDEACDAVGYSKGDRDWLDLLHQGLFYILQNVFRVTESILEFYDGLKWREDECIHFLKISSDGIGTKWIHEWERGYLVKVNNRNG